MKRWGTEKGCLTPIHHPFALPLTLSFGWQPRVPARRHTILRGILIHHYPKHTELTHPLLQRHRGVLQPPMKQIIKLCSKGTLSAVDTTDCNKGGNNNDSCTCMASLLKIKWNKINAKRLNVQKKGQLLTLTPINFQNTVRKIPANMNRAGAYRSLGGVSVVAVNFQKGNSHSLYQLQGWPLQCLPGDLASLTHRVCKPKTRKLQQEKSDNQIGGWMTPGKPRNQAEA